MFNHIHMHNQICDKFLIVHICFLYVLAYLLKQNYILRKNNYYCNPSNGLCIYK